MCFRPCVPHHGCCHRPHWGGCRPHHPGFCGMPNPFCGPRPCGNNFMGGGNIINVFNGGGCCGGGGFLGGCCGGSFANGLASALTGCGCGSEASAWGRITGSLLFGGLCF